MQINLMLNGVRVSDDVAPDTLLIDFVRRHGCLSVKRGCETSNCGLCTVFLDDKPVLSCSVLAARADGHKVTTLEGLQEEAAEFGAFIADQGAEQCGFCNPGFIMNALALFRENPYPSAEEIKEYLSGNLCRCSGYEGQLRGILNFLDWIGLGINQLIMWLGTDWLEGLMLQSQMLSAFARYAYMIVKIFATAVVMVYNFITRKIFIEKH